MNSLLKYLLLDLFFFSFRFLLSFFYVSLSHVTSQSFLVLKRSTPLSFSFFFSFFVVSVIRRVFFLRPRLSALSLLLSSRSLLFFRLSVAHVLPQKLSSLASFSSLSSFPFPLGQIDRSTSHTNSSSSSPLQRAPYQEHRVTLFFLFCASSLSP